MPAITVRCCALSSSLSCQSVEEEGSSSRSLRMSAWRHVRGFDNQTRPHNQQYTQDAQHKRWSHSQKLFPRKTLVKRSEGSSDVPENCSNGCVLLLQCGCRDLSGGAGAWPSLGRLGDGRSVSGAMASSHAVCRLVSSRPASVSRYSGCLFPTDFRSTSYEPARFGQAEPGMDIWFLMCFSDSQHTHPCPQGTHALGADHLAHGSFFRNTHFSRLRLRMRKRGPSDTVHQPG